MRSCPNCGHILEHAKPHKPKALAIVPQTDLATLSTAELFAHYKRTAPAEDLRFWLDRARMSPELRAGFEALKYSSEQLTISRPAFYQQLHRLQDAWRRESNARENKQAERKWRAGLEYRKACAELARMIQDTSVPCAYEKHNLVYSQTIRVCRLAAELMPWKFNAESEAA